ncbi:adenylate/guanylate cyclase domain-containing protein [Deltaproteobacteria bacterium TL4]
MASSTRILLLFLLLGGLIIGSCGQQKPVKLTPKGVNGVLDLRAWDFEQEGPVDLSGEWEFYWEQLLDPNDFNYQNSPQKTGLITLPSVWNGYQVAGKTLSGEGYATFKLKVQLPEQKNQYALNLPEQATAFLLWIDNEVAGRNGTVGKTPSEMIPQFLPYATSIRHSSTTMELVLQVSNFYYRKGGVWYPIVLGLEPQIHKKRDRWIFLEVFLLGSILIMALYHLGLYSLRKTDQSPLYFGTVCLLISVRILCTGEKTIFLLFPDFSWELALEMEYISFYFGPPFFLMYVRSLYENEISEKILFMAQCLGVFFSLFVLFTKSSIYTHTAIPYQVVALSFVLYILYGLVLASVRKREGALLILGGMLFFSITFVNDLLYVNLIIATGNFFSLGLFVFIFSQSFLLSLRFSKAFVMVEDLSKNLEKKVEHRTHELQTAQNQLLQINQIAKKVHSTLDLEAASKTFITEVVPLIRSKGSGSVLLYNEEKNTLMLHSSFGLNPKYVKEFELEVSPQTLYSYEVFASKHSMIFDLDTLKPFQNEESLKLHLGRQYVQQLISPLVSNEKTLGLVTISQYDLQAPYTRHDQLLLDNITLDLSQHFANASLYEETQAKEREITHINEVVKTVNASLDLDETMLSIVASLQDVFLFDQVGILLFDADKQNLVLSRCYGSGFSTKQVEQLKNILMPFHEDVSFMVKAALSKKVVYLPEITAEILENLWPEDQKIHNISQSKSYLFCPLEVQKQLIGVISFADSRTPFVLSDSQLKRVERYVNPIATAINNAHLYNELKTTQVELAESKKITEMTAIFEKFVPKQFLSRIAHEGLVNLKLGDADADNVTILFSDIRSFTSLAETMTPQELLRFLNAYTQKISEPIHAYRGYIDKYIGDAIMALFDIPQATDNVEAENAICAAIEMHGVLKEYNTYRAKSGYPPIKMGIGIHSGPVIFGTVGSQNRMDTTVLGDTVNVASRLEGLTKTYGTDILVSFETLNLLQNLSSLKYREVDMVRVYGKKEPIGIYEIFNHELKEIQDLKAESSRYIGKGLICRINRDWEQCMKFFKKALDLYPEDRLALYHLNQCRVLKFAKLPEDWDGSVNLTHK